MPTSTIEEKLEILGELSKFDKVSFSPDLNKYFKYSHFIYKAVGFKGKTCNLFKVLQTNLCKYNCFYCANRLYRNTKRFIFKPKELASIFLSFYKKKLVEGLFLSSGIYPDANSSQEKIYITLKLIRDSGFKGYIHSVILPGTDLNLINKIGLLSDRLSLNLETISQEHLSLISPNKDFNNDLFSGLSKIYEFCKEKNFKTGFTTQLVVGAANERDRDILFFSKNLYNKFNLERIYYSGFTPIEDTPFENKNPCSLNRELRLYQADFLMRYYGFKPEEFIYNEKGNLFENIDPKLLWAFKNRDFFPVEINTAEKEKLLRVPGIGLTSTNRIINLRRKTNLTFEDLKKIGVVIKRAKNFITIGGKSYIEENFFKRFSI